MWYDVSDLKKIEEFENLDFWVLYKIAEMLNKKSIDQEKYEDAIWDLSDAESRIAELEDDKESLSYEVDKMQGIIEDVYIAKDKERVTEIIDKAADQYGFKSRWYYFLKDRSKDNELSK